MSHRPLRKPKTSRTQRDRGRSPKGLVAGGFTSLAAATLLATVSVVADSPAQAAVTSQASATNHAHAHAAHNHAHDMTAAQHYGVVSEIAVEGSLPLMADESLPSGAEPLADAVKEARMLQQEAEDQKRQQEEEALKRHQEEEAASRAAAPVAPGEYSLGSGWGAVGAWSRYHTGVDLQAPVGTPVYAAAPGVVGPSDAGGWAGVHAVIEHDDGSSLYAHLASLTVKPGDKIDAGQLIGYVGMSGRTFGAHLHFEFYPKGAPTSDPYKTSDPYRWLETRGVRL